MMGVWISWGVVARGGPSALPPSFPFPSVVAIWKTCGFLSLLSEPLPKEENAAVFLLWTPPFPFEYWVIPWRTDAKGTELWNGSPPPATAVTGDSLLDRWRRPSAGYTAASRHAHCQGSGHWGLGFWRCCVFASPVGLAAIHVSYWNVTCRPGGHPRFLLERHLSAFGHPRFSFGRSLGGRD